MSMPIAAFGPESVLMKPTFTLSAACAVTASARPIPKRIARMSSPLSLFALDAHLLIDDLAPFDHHFAVELYGAIAHGHIVMTSRIALSAALRIRTRGKQEVAREGSRRRAMALR